MTLMDRHIAARLGNETVAILAAGVYTGPAGRHVENALEQFLQNLPY